ncbi:MetQ/NlpA family ABC transporter substrate-binding protein [Alkalihalobacillus pseudalcaliphilus]|uniref:MetQ/NlpA family ABC transporter substrate-binding protein n=1 Tax=Alkalihalobacillus pseudalcaliphilus TaxID=79884 RepID=UPI00064E13B3|nr:MetQ/NlpA family ABC transporter substrate-binding protein [Alkalihalobacillus pseudalcaliphilus]KMK78211.1 methionine ABC transporter ATPase [Alkalihalobacillus pseudalcaliphilus]
MKDYLFLILMMLSLLFVLFGCSTVDDFPAKEGGSKAVIVFGFTPGPYSDQVRQGIEPLLKEKGYTVKYVEFSTPNEPNFALAEGSLDVNIFQHTAFFENFIEENQLDLIETIKVPTAPMGIYSDHHDNLDHLQDGFTIAIPNDPANVARALRVLEQVGWLELKENYDPLTVSRQDIDSMIVNFSFVELEQVQIPRAIPDVDFAVANGYTIIASNRELDSSLFLEDPPFEYQNLIAIRAEDQDQPFIQDIIEAYHTRDFQEVIESNKEFEGFHQPDYFK